MCALVDELTTNKRPSSPLERVFYLCSIFLAMEKNIYYTTKAGELQMSTKIGEKDRGE